jgi:hypothetical protein
MNRSLALLLAAVMTFGTLPLPAQAQSSGKRHAVRFPAASATIDAEIGAKLQQAGIAPAPLAGDEEFLRRVTLDLTGRIPTPAEVDAFLADPTPATKRARKIDELLASDAFTDRWTLWLGDLVQNVQASTNIREYYLGRNAYYHWIRESIRTAKPYDQLVRELLAGEGNSFESGVANYVVRQIQRNGPPQDTYDNLAAHSAEKFLGIPMLCISCHNGGAHLEAVNTYLRNKKREDFWKMAAFFARVTTRGSRYTDPANPNANVIQFEVGSNPAGVYRLNTTDGNKTPRAPLSGQPATVTPAFLLTGEQPRGGEPYRAAYGRMLTADRQFARNTVNQLWKEMFGRGFVEPVNAFDLEKLDTQPSHPALLEALATQFMTGGYSLRGLLRTIATSDAYQRATVYPGSAPDPSYFAYRNRHRLPAEMLLDAVGDATAVPVRFNTQSLGVITSAIELADPLEARRQSASQFLDRCGRGDRDDVARTNDGSISQALSLLNDPLITSRVRRAGNSTVQKLLASTKDPGSIADQLYLATLSRRPTADERRIAIDYLGSGTLGDKAEDLQFALINSLEFLFV